MITADHVMDAALAVMRRGGVEALSMRRLADELGASYQIVYSRIGGKADVVRAIHDRGFARLVATLRSLDVAPGTPDRVHALATGYVRMALADPLLFELMFASPVPEFVRDARARAVEHDAFRAVWVAAVGAWLDRALDTRPPGTARRLAWQLWTVSHGVATVHLAGHGSPSGDPEREVEAIARVLMADPLAAATA